MKLCFLADARSPIAQNWIRYFIQAGHDVHVLSSYLCDPATLPGASIQTVPVAFSWLASGLVKHESRKEGERERLVRPVRKTLMPLLSRLRHWLGPLDVYRYVGQIRHAAAKLQPDLVHAMRIPFEGILAAEALTRSSVPLLVSVWGNDFTLACPRVAADRLPDQRAMARAMPYILTVIVTSSWRSNGVCRTRNPRLFSRAEEVFRPTCFIRDQQIDSW